MATAEKETLRVLLAQAGDREALDELFKSVQAPLYGYILSLTADRSLAEDTLQEVFIKIYRKLRWLREPALFRPWAYRIATREAFKLLKRERRWSDQIRGEAVLESIPAPSGTDLLPSGLLEHLPELVAKVSPASRAVIVLHYMHDMKLEDVAEVLGLAVGTVKSRLAYGLARIRKAVAEKGIHVGSEADNPANH